MGGREGRPSCKGSAAIKHTHLGVRQLPILFSRQHLAWNTYLQDRFMITRLLVKSRREVNRFTGGAGAVYFRLRRCNRLPASPWKPGFRYISR